MITIMRLFLHPPENAMFREKQKFFLQQKSISQIQKFGVIFVLFSNVKSKNRKWSSYSSYKLIFICNKKMGNETKKELYIFTPYFRYFFCFRHFKNGESSRFWWLQSCSKILICATMLPSQVSNLMAQHCQKKNIAQDSLFL